MRKSKLLMFIICILLIQKVSFSQIYFAADAQKKISEASSIAYEKGNTLPIYIKLQSGKEIDFNNWQSWLSKRLKYDKNIGFVLQNMQTDQLGEVHYRYNQTYNGATILGKNIIVHTRNNKVFSFNGKLISAVNTAPTATLSEDAALKYALGYVNASIYKWQVPGEEAMLKKISGNQEASYYPKGELYIVPDKGNYRSQNHHLTYRFDIYADTPMSRQYIFVDATTGEITFTMNRIENTDVHGTALTKYSGTQSITTDSVSPGSYRLRETDRGNGIETYNMLTGSNYNTAVDFTDVDNYWNNVNAQKDEIAGDAHWGAEMTYDFYKNKFNRNSIDNNGYKLMSYVHYQVGYNNAFWDGTKMTYGDGDGTTYQPFTALDICGHEITHGLESNTSQFNAVNETGALSEGFSDIFGTCIEWYAKPATANWTMGEDIGTVIRDMSNPKAHGQPDTYKGINWDSITQEVHQNDGVLIYWFYLLAHGKSGTNDNGVAYNISGISLDSAAAVAYRTLTVYLSSASDYADTRFYSILSAMDLFGACTPKVEQVTDAWYAVGVGGPYNPTVTSNFNANFTALCSAPSTVHFSNMSTNSNLFLWNFGDGSTSTAMNPDHIYNSYGTFNVSLIAYGGSCGNDTIVKNAYISVDSANPCIVILPPKGTAPTQTICSGILFDSGGSSNYQDSTNSTITIAPIGAMNVTLHFDSFNFENTYDFLTIYDGPNTSTPLIGSYTDSILPNGGTIVSTSGTITLVQTSDMAVNFSGFELHWQCAYPTTHPTTNFKADDTLNCTGTVSFIDLSTNGPTSWAWEFGDGGVSNLQYPAHTYISNGTYSVKLKTGNTFGLDSLIKTSYITINKPLAPIGFSASRCDSGSVTLTATATGGTTLYWYDAPNGGNLVHTGSPFVTPALGATTTYYVQTSASSIAQYVGPADNTIGTGGISAFPSYRYDIFDVYVPLTLKSVKVYADSSRIRNIELDNAAGTMIKDTNIFIPAGTSWVNLNFDIPAGTGYRLGAQGPAGLYRNQSGASFPYTAAGMLSITGTSSASPTAYYYFYDWEIEKQGCLSNMVPVTAGILLPNAQVTSSGSLNICQGQSVTLTCQSADSYHWLPGNQTTQAITITTAGSYTVQITKDSCTANSLPVLVTAGAPVVGFTFVKNDSLVTFTSMATNATTFLWHFGDGVTSALQNPTHIYTTDGTYTVTLKETNTCGSDTITHTLIISVGISSFENNHSISIYPNPSNGSFYVDIQTSDNTEINYRIYDIIGNTIKTASYKPISNKTKLVIDMSDASKGVYMLHIWNTSFNTTKRIINN
jgi:Zn-dependent metalloprotease